MKALLACVAAVCLLISTAASSAVQAVVDEMKFEVLLDDKHIGSHTFRISRNGTVKRVQTEAAFNVKVLFVTVYSYRHVNDELWRSGCLQQIRSQTDSNGDLYQVQGQGVDSVFRVNTQSDFQTYADWQARVATDFKNTSGWARKSILNTARMGKFSSDRSIQEYCERIWKTKPVSVELRSI